MNEKYIVNFINQNQSIEVNKGTTISGAFKAAGLPLNLECNGMGLCGKCMVKIEKEGSLSNVLACITAIDSNLNIYSENGEQNSSLKANILESYTPEDNYEFRPLITKSYVDINDLKIKSEEYLQGCDFNALKKYSDLMYEENCKGITFIKEENHIIDIQPNNTTAYLYGAAIDIGTTSVVIYIYDLNTGILLKTYSELNMQISLGADIISRINYAQSKSGLNELKDKILLTINKMLYEAQLEFPYFTDNIYNIVMCGNSAMQHLLFGFRTDGLGCSPFVNITKDYVECFGNEIEINCPERSRLVFLPLLGGFVGSDMTSVLLASEDDNKIKLIIDLGTNGEIAVGNINKYLVASTACGPALEGGSIDWGMRGTIGAIDRFKIEKDEIHFRTIGGSEPKGICGSGVLDIASELLRMDIIDETGRMITGEELARKSPGSKLCDKLIQINGITVFVLYSDNDKTIYISQKDIRQIQLAKSSIYSGCIALIEAYGINLNEIDEIILSGAFGNYIDIYNAVKIGLLPYRSNINFKSIGNGAGMGVCMYLLDKNMKKKCDGIVKNTIHYELAGDEGYTKGFIENMNFDAKIY